MVSDGENSLFTLELPHVAPHNGRPPVENSGGRGFVPGRPAVALGAGQGFCQLRVSENVVRASPAIAVAIIPVKAENVLLERI